MPGIPKLFHNSAFGGYNRGFWPRGVLTPPAFDLTLAGGSNVPPPSLERPAPSIPEANLVKPVALRRDRASNPSMVVRILRRVCAAWMLSTALALTLLAPASLLAETKALNGEVKEESGKPLPGAVCTLTGALLPSEGLTVTTDEKGQFQFTGLTPSTYTLTCAAVGHVPLYKGDIAISEAEPPFLEMVLPVEQVLRQKVEVTGQAGTITRESTAPPARLSGNQLILLPLVEQKFKAALPLVPGVVRTPNGRINIKGTSETQGLLLVNSAEMVDPVTGSFSIEVPIDAVESLQVYKSAYRAEYGRFSGGLTAVETKAPADKWDFEVNDFLPTPRVKSGHIIGIADDEPRLYLTGPLLQNRLNFSEALAYDMIKQPVRGLPWPHNEIKTQGYNSLASFQLILSPRQLVTTHLDFFPLRRQFANINSLLPQPASSDYGQDGFALGSTHRYMFDSGGILTSLFQYTRFDSNSHGQGSEDMLITPDGFGGNYFNNWNRRSNQSEILETYQLPHHQWAGKHDIELGVNYVRRTFTGSSQSRPVLLQREDGTLAEQIDFSGPGQLGVTDNEVALFIQDHWTFSEHLAMDAGFRFSTQNVGEPAALAPRFGLVYTPGSGGKTIFRGGVGVFYDRVPLLAADFINNPTRSVQLFDTSGLPAGPPLVFQNAYIKTQENGQQIVPSHNRLDSTPYNLTWNFEVNQEIVPHLVLRASFLGSRTRNQFIIDPLNQAGTPPTLLLSNTGGSHYHEFETTLRYRPGERMDLNFSYVYSLARGDLNTLGNIYVPFEQPVIRPDVFATLPANVPHRFITWGRIGLPAEVTVSPVLDIHSGFPWSVLNDLQNYVGTPNSQRLPTFASLDLRITKDFRIAGLPWLKNHKLRFGFAIFNVTNHANPRDVYNVNTSPFFRTFQGFQHRFFDASFDIVY